MEKPEPSSRMARKRKVVDLTPSQEGNEERSTATITSSYRGTALNPWLLPSLPPTAAAPSVCLLPSTGALLGPVHAPSSRTESPAPVPLSAPTPVRSHHYSALRTCLTNAVPRLPLAVAGTVHPPPPPPPPPPHHHPHHPHLHQRRDYSESKYCYVVKPKAVNDATEVESEVEEAVARARVAWTEEEEEEKQQELVLDTTMPDQKRVGVKQDASVSQSAASSLSSRHHRQPAPNVKQEVRPTLPPSPSSAPAPFSFSNWRPPYSADVRSVDYPAHLAFVPFARTSGVAGGRGGEYAAVSGPGGVVADGSGMDWIPHRDAASQSPTQSQTQPLGHSSSTSCSSSSSSHSDSAGAAHYDCTRYTTGTMLLTKLSHRSHLYFLSDSSSSSNSSLCIGPPVPWCAGIDGCGRQHQGRLLPVLPARLPPGEAGLRCGLGWWTEEQQRRRKLLPNADNNDSDDDDDDQSSDRHVREAEDKTEEIACAGLSDDQRRVLEFVEEGENVFFSGSAGTGKSYLLLRIMKRLQRKYARKCKRTLGRKKKGDCDDEEANDRQCNCYKCKVAVTASTGIAAENVEGTTIHSFAGCGLGEIKQDFDKMWARDTNRARWRSLEVLIIDEISMLSGEFFECLESRVSDIRAYKKLGHILPPAYQRDQLIQHLPAFGGIQVIVLGDFYQLPPISRRKHVKRIQEKYRNEKRQAPPQIADILMNETFAFECEAWKKCQFKSVMLTVNQRQVGPTNADFVQVLNELRLGRVTPNAEKMLNGCTRELVGGPVPTVLYGTNQQALEYNVDKLGRCPEPEFVFLAKDSVEVLPPPPHAEGERPYDWDAERAEMEKELWSQEFWEKCSGKRKIQFRLEAEVMLLKNLDQESRDPPLTLVNGSLGTIIRIIPIATVINAIELLCKDQAEPESDQARLRDQLDFLISLPARYADPHPKINPPPRVPMGLPLVVLIGTCVRWQLPLQLAWSLTIHKCQGLTLDRAIIHSIGGTSRLQCGQAYVALSRVRSLATTQIPAGFGKNAVRADAKVGRFYEQLGVEGVGAVPSAVTGAAGVGMRAEQRERMERNKQEARQRRQLSQQRLSQGGSCSSQEPGAGSD